MLEVNGLYKTLENGYEKNDVLQGVNLIIEQGKLYTLLGPSGCGKSTVLRCVAGLEKPTKGEIKIDHTLVYSSNKGVNIPVNNRDIGMVFQSYAIWPHMDVFHNVAFPLIHGKHKYSQEEIKHKVKEALKMVQLDVKETRPAPMLSGGQQQRVALARALVYEPKLLLLDEPLSNLDAKLRVEMRKEIRRIVEQYKITTLFVTHDQSEALSLSDRIGVLYNGVILQEGTPKEIYTRPKSTFVAKFVGNSNLLKGRIVAIDRDSDLCSVETAYGIMRGVPVEPLAMGTPVNITFRPEDFSLETQNRNGEQNVLHGKIQALMFTGVNMECQLLLRNELFEIKFQGLQNINNGDEIFINIPPENCAVFSQPNEDIKKNNKYFEAG